MADELEILVGSFKGIPLSIAGGSLEGGRKTVVHSFPSRDTQSVEDLGLAPRRYSLEVIIKSEDYFGYRNRLLAALESDTPGELVHPFYGRISNTKATTYSLNETIGEFGAANVSVSFEIDNSTGIPVVAENTVSQVREGQLAAVADVQTNIAGSFNVTPAYFGNFAAAVGKVQSIIDTAQTSTAFVGETSDQINEFSALIGQLSGDINSLVTQPIALADSIVGLFESMNGLYASADATLDTMRGFFGFGADDDESETTTAGLIERNANTDTLNGAANALALSYAYLAATEAAVATVADIDALGQELNAQYQVVQNSGASDPVKSALTDLRVATLKTLNAVRLTLPQILTVETNETTARLLAFDYYGSDDNAQTIVDLNRIYDPSFVEGSVDILTV